MRGVAIGMSSRFCARTVLLVFLVPLLAGCEIEATKMDIRTLETRTKSNDALACPADTCRVPADFESPDFAISERELLSKVQAIIAAEPRTELVEQDETLMQLVFVQRSRVFRFPDTVWIQAVKRGSNTSIVIYSKSNVGDSDLGVNKKRVRNWLTKISDGIGVAKAGS